MRERDLRNGFTIPPRVTLHNAVDMAFRLPWLARLARTPRVTFANYVTDEKRDIVSLAAHMASLLDPEAGWRDVEWLRELWRGPLLIKGVLHPAEARRAVEIGLDGVIVSNHGGRQLDGAIASIDALPGVVAAVEGRIPVLIDGGIRRGAHVVKALALGATACLIGRPHLWGLAVGGEAGVSRVLDLLRRDIDRVLALGGWDGVGAVGPTAVRWRRGTEWSPGRDDRVALRAG
jgi:L-lactate dehydrogenase (cytochrome)/(S)-mandelate dehydrogenase